MTSGGGDFLTYTVEAYIRRAALLASRGTTAMLRPILTLTSLQWCEWGHYKQSNEHSIKFYTIIFPIYISWHIN